MSLSRGLGGFLAVRSEVIAEVVVSPGAHPAIRQQRRYMGLTGVQLHTAETGWNRRRRANSESRAVGTPNHERVVRAHGDAKPLPAGDRLVLHSDRQRRHVRLTVGVRAKGLDPAVGSQ